MKNFIVFYCLVLSAFTISSSYSQWTMFENNFDKETPKQFSLQNFFQPKPKKSDVIEDFLLTSTALWDQLIGEGVITTVITSILDSAINTMGKILPFVAKILEKYQMDIVEAFKTIYHVGFDFIINFIIAVKNEIEDAFGFWGNLLLLPIRLLIQFIKFPLEGVLGIEGPGLITTRSASKIEEKYNCSVDPKEFDSKKTNIENDENFKKLEEESYGDIFGNLLDKVSSTLGLRDGNFENVKLMDRKMKDDLFWKKLNKVDYQQKFIPERKYQVPFGFYDYDPKNFVYSYVPSV